MKSAKRLNPEIKFSSFLKKIPQNSKDNPIDKILTNKIVNDFSNTEIRNSHKQTGNDNNILTKEKIEELNNNTEAMKIEEVENPNEIQFFEREISYEEEANLRKALTNHFIFQELNEEIM